MTPTKSDLTTNTHNSMIQMFIEIISFFVFTFVQMTISCIKYCTPISMKTKKNIEGEIALVTGAGSGIGRLTALRLARLRVKVVIWDINEEGLQETVALVKANGGFCKGYKVDLCDKEQVYKIAKQTVAEVGEISILINNAGYVAGKNLLDTSDEQIKRTFDVNVISHFWTTKAFLPAMMKKNKGHIVTIASLAGHVGVHKLIDYCASKHAAVGFDEALKFELEIGGYNGIYTSCICPFFIQSTGMFESVQARLFSRLSSNQVADEIVDSILYNKGMVYIPNCFAIGLILKRIIPWTVYSFVIRLLVVDPAPTEDTNNQVTKPIETIPTMNDKYNDTEKVSINRRTVQEIQERQP